MAAVYNPFVYWGQNKAKIFLKVDIKEVSVSALDKLRYFLNMWEIFQMYVKEQRRSKGKWTEV